jgi:hypothetical protein
MPSIMDSAELASVAVFQVATPTGERGAERWRSVEEIADHLANLACDDGGAAGLLAAVDDVAARVERYALIVGSLDEGVADKASAALLTAAALVI